MNWKKVKLKSTGYPALDMPPKYISIPLCCEHVNYLLYHYGYLDKGFRLVDFNQVLTESQLNFIDNLFSKWVGVEPNNKVTITKEEWNSIYEIKNY
jgi:hypothetical protein